MSTRPKLVRLAKPKGDPDLINTLVVALDSARAGKLRAASVIVIVDKGRWQRRTFCGSTGKETADKMELIGLMERTKHNMLSALLDADCETYAENGSFDPDDAS
jgi:hypothetical protein